MKKKIRKLITLSIMLLILLIIIWIIYKININIDDLLYILQTNKDKIQLWISNNYINSIIIYIVSMIIIILLSLPLVTILSVSSGYFFGIWAGAILSMIGFVAGCALMFLIIRILSSKYGYYVQLNKYKKINNILKTNMFNYIFVLNILPATPIFLTNTLAALSPISLKKFLLATFLGIAPSCFIYTIVGQKFNTIKTIKDLLSKEIIFILIIMGILGLIPIIIKYFWPKLWSKYKIN